MNTLQNYLLGMKYIGSEKQLPNNGFIIHQSDWAEKQLKLLIDAHDE